MEVVQKTKLGTLMQGDSTEIPFDTISGEVQLLFTSPPYRTHSTMAGYCGWLRSTFTRFKPLLKPDGSMVVVLGSDWSPPYQRYSPFIALSSIAKVLPICQQFVIAHEHSMVSPSVEKEMAALCETRALDVVEHAWWYGHEPKAKLGHASNAIMVGRGPIDLDGRSMPVSEAAAFIQALTDEGDLVLDPFAGTNSTGVAAELYGRRWLSIEKDAETCATAARRLTKPVQS